MPTAHRQNTLEVGVSTKHWPTRDCKREGSSGIENAFARAGLRVAISPWCERPQSHSSSLSSWLSKGMAFSLWISLMRVQMFCTFWMDL